MSSVADVGVPLDAQRVPFTGTYPSLGPGEPLAGQINSVVIGHGLFSLLDAFPFQHPEAPELSVSIPIENRLFGQGARARFDNVRVIIKDRHHDERDEEAEVDEGQERREDEDHQAERD